jgi:hypothetical protein
LEQTDLILANLLQQAAQTQQALQTGQTQKSQDPAEFQDLMREKAAGAESQTDPAGNTETGLAASGKQTAETPKGQKTEEDELLRQVAVA